MSGMKYLKQFDKRQLFRFFVDGRFHKKNKYDGWVGYEAREEGSAYAMLNAYSFMMDNFHNANNLTGTYIRELHRTAMFNVKTSNPKSSPGDIRYTNTGLPLFQKTTTFESLEQIINMRKGDGTIIFNTKELYGRKAEEIDVKVAFKLLQEQGKLNYRGWMPNIDKHTQDAIDGKLSLHEFYEAKHHIQMQIVYKIEEYLDKYNKNIKFARNDDDKIEVIATLTRELEALHPFPDGNCRIVVCVLMNQLLIYNNLPPAIVLNPNLDFEYSLEQWIEEIKYGIDITLQLLENPSKIVYDYSIDEMSKENQDKFLEMAKEFIEKINNYEEIFLNAEKLKEYTNGYWINEDLSQNYKYIGTHGSYYSGDVYFATIIEQWQKDGKDIKQELLKCQNKGIRAIVIDSTKYIKDLSIPVLVVDDVQKAFEDTAKGVRQDVNPKTVLLTGTEGKTGSKIQLYYLLKNQAKTHAYLDSSNTGIPIFKSLATMEEDLEIELNEFSVDANEDKTTSRAKIVNPDLCFFSNISSEHMHVHGSLEGVISHKSAVIEGIRENGQVILNSSMATYEQFVEKLKSRAKVKINISTFGMTENDDAQLLNKEFDSDKLGWNIKARIDEEILEYFIPMFQNHAPLMSVGALLTVKRLGYDVLKASKDYLLIKSYESMGNISKIKKDDGTFLFYDQSRRASISSVRSVFEDLKNIKVIGNKIALFGSISSVKDNDWTKEYHKELAMLINNSDIKYLFTTGPNMQYLHENLKNPEILIAHSDDLNYLHKEINELIKAGDLLLIQGYQRLYLDVLANKFISNIQIQTPAKLINQTSSTNKFDENIYSIGLNEEQISLYKQLLIAEDFSNGLDNDFLIKKYGINQSTLDEIKQKYSNYKLRKSNIMLSFFKKLEDFLLKKYKIKSFDSQLKEYDKYLYNEQNCTNWFNNVLKNSNEPIKHLFGTFFDFGDKELLLHFMAGTTNLHIGFVKYSNKNGKIEIIPFDEDDKLTKKLNEKLPDNLKLTFRKWAHKWITIDVGSFINLENANDFQAMVDFENSSMYKNKFKPLIDSILKD